MSLDRIQRNWEAFGRQDPLWAILTWPDKRDGRWDREEFFATGRQEVAAMLQRTRALAPTVRTGRALDFGCGVGRLSRALRASFDQVHAVDIAQSMIDQARKLDREQTVTWHCNQADDLGRFVDDHFDLIYSSITLQHLPRRLAAGYVAEFGRILAPGGVTVFQLPERLRNKRSRHPVRRLLGYVAGPIRGALRRLQSRGPIMEMHGTPRAEVTDWLARAGLEVLAVDDNTMAGADWFSAIYFARKP